MPAGGELVADDGKAGERQSDHDRDRLAVSEVDEADYESCEKCVGSEPALLQQYAVAADDVDVRKRGSCPIGRRVADE